VRAAQRNLDYFSEFARNLRDEIADGNAEDADWAGVFKERFHEAVNNDLNTPQALAVALDLVAEAYRRNDHRIWNTLKAFDTVLGLGLERVLAETREAKFPAEICRLIAERDRARKEKKFARSDELRKELTARGYEVKDTAEGSTYVPRTA